MIDLLRKYESKLVAQGLCDEGAPLFGALDAELAWNRKDAAAAVMEDVIGGLNIASILFARPAEPYFSILNLLAARAAEGFFVPGDSETRTFFHDIPVSDRFDAPTIIGALKKRRSIFIRDHGIVTYGTVSPEQAFIVFSSVCFSGFVKFFTDALVSKNVEAGDIIFLRDAMERYRGFIESARDRVPSHAGPFAESARIYDAIIEAGRLTVERRLVDSFFGNISYRDGGTIYISQTGSSLDELAGCIDPCPVDGSTCAAITASSEYTAHRDILASGDARAILHGHPRFSVIMSMICEKENCDNRGQCHRLCSTPRFIGDVPIVPGEIGTGRYGLCNTLPPALKGRRGAIVWGHGLFTTGRDDFREAFRSMVEIELMCLEEYGKALGEKTA
jgi:ribulose-5-phosphate 4-epimerase/fuculose-1-phosphate aldolase